MATTVDLGKVRPVWKGAWSSSTAYEVHDMVKNGVHSYICTTGHTSSSTFSSDSANWDDLAQGAELPLQTGNAGKVLKTDGAGTLSWGASDDASALTQGTLHPNRLPFIGIQKYNTSHDASGTINWGDTPSQGSPASGFGYTLGEAADTFGWNGSTFTVKQAGLWFVYGTVIPVTSSDHLYMYIYKNGVKQTDNRSSGGGSYHENVYSQAVLNCAVNDTITIQVTPNVHGGSYGNINIFKIGNV